MRQTAHPLTAGDRQASSVRLLCALHRLAKCMGLIISTTLPPMRDVSHDSLAAFIHRHMLDGDVLLAPRTTYPRRTDRTHEECQRERHKRLMDTWVKDQTVRDALSRPVPGQRTVSSYTWNDSVLLVRCG
jgi:hypothetical protein